MLEEDYQKTVRQVEHQGGNMGCPGKDLGRGTGCRLESLPASLSVSTRSVLSDVRRRRRRRRRGLISVRKRSRVSGFRFRVQGDVFALLT